MIELVQGRTLLVPARPRAHIRSLRRDICYLEGQDVSEIMVRRGVARDCPRFSGWRNAEAERRAAADGATIGGELPAAKLLPPAVGRREAWADPRRAVRSSFFFAGVVESEQ